MFNLSKMRIGAKIVLGFLIVILTFFIMGTYNYIELNKIEIAVEHIENGALFDKLRLQHEIWAKKLGAIFYDRKISDIDVELDHRKCRMGKFIYGEEGQGFIDNYPQFKDNWRQIQVDHEELHKSASEMKLSLDNPEKMKGIYNTTTLVKLSKVSEGLGGISRQLDQMAKGSSVNLASMINSIANYSLILFLIALFLGLSSAYLLTSSINKLLKKVIIGITNSSDSLVIGSEQIAQCAAESAIGASEQASSLEETAAAIEEISAQAQQNVIITSDTVEAVNSISDTIIDSAGKTRKAGEISNQVRSKSENGHEAIEKLYTAMKDMLETSNKVSGIVEVINGITDKTKMLSLNAAIEAARAGVHGKGFAVVADEVSSLAENSRAASADIIKLISDTIQKSEAGNKLTTETLKSLGGVLNGIVQTTELINQVTLAVDKESKEIAEIVNKVEQVKISSKEQCYAVNEISKAMSDIDRVTQQNAASSEESAAAASELLKQAKDLKKLIEEAESYI